MLGDVGGGHRSTRLGEGPDKKPVANGFGNQTPSSPSKVLTSLDLQFPNTWRQVPLLTAPSRHLRTESLDWPELCCLRSLPTMLISNSVIPQLTSHLVGSSKCVRVTLNLNPEDLPKDH